MQISSRFTLAVHIFACIDTFKDDYKVTSEFLAGSTNVNPVIVRKILGQLKAAGLVEVARGSGGASIAKPLNEITFLDIYRAVECVGAENYFISMTIPIRTARWERTFIRYWMKNYSGCRRRWSGSLRPLHLRMCMRMPKNIYRCDI